MGRAFSPWFIGKLADLGRCPIIAKIKSQRGRIGSNLLLIIYQLPFVIWIAFSGAMLFYSIRISKFGESLE